MRSNDVVCSVMGDFQFSIMSAVLVLVFCTCSTRTSPSFSSAFSTLQTPCLVLWSCFAIDVIVWFAKGFLSTMPRTSSEVLRSVTIVVISFLLIIINDLLIVIYKRFGFVQYLITKKEVLVVDVPDGLVVG